MNDSTTLSRETFEARLRAKEVFYHIHHPFHVRMAEGSLDRSQIQGWVANRFYYQVMIPVKDANILANCPDRETRRLWIQRIKDHDGDGEHAGGIEAWTRLGEAVGIPRDDLWSLKQVLPGVRFAVDAYVHFARSHTWQEAACSSLTEMFAPTIHRQRLSGWPEHYPWIEREGLAYFQNRVTQANRDVEHGLAITLDHFTTPAQQDKALDILQFKLDVLWSMLDSMWLAYVDQKPLLQRQFKTMTIENDLRWALSPMFRLQWEETQQRYVLLYPEGMVELNLPAAEILQRCDGTQCLDDIVEALEAKFETTGLRSDIEEMLEAALRHGWIRHVPQR